jgi:probable phosphoglycerate mutase
MNTLICLVRHGVTPWNYEGRAQGRSDVPLSIEGQRQAELMALRIAQEPWDAVYSSTLSRAYHTAQAIARLTGHTVIQDDRLVERHMGAAEGSTFAERSVRWPGLPWSETPGFETDEELAARAHAALTDMVAQHPGQRLVCVAHGGLIAVFLSTIALEADPNNLYVHQRNTSFTLVRHDGERFVQESPSDFAHLLLDGVEYTGEKGRIHSGVLGALLGPQVPANSLPFIVSYATAVESAWQGEHLVGFARLFTDGVLHGYVDLVDTAPGFDHVVPQLIKRFEERYPDIPIIHLHGQERTGD